MPVLIIGNVPDNNSMGSSFCYDCGKSIIVPIKLHLKNYDKFASDKTIYKGVFSNIIQIISLCTITQGVHD